MNTRKRHRRAAFTLVELLVVIGILALLLSLLVPVLSQSRRAGQRTQCLAHMKNLGIAHMAYAAEHKFQLVSVSGSATAQDSWITLLQPYSDHPLARRCPSDASMYFDIPYSPGVYRLASYAINNYVSPTHSAVFGGTPIRRLTEIKNQSRVIHFGELAESGGHAASDHLHIQDFDNPVPQLVLSSINEQMPVGRHGGQKGQWSGMLNYCFIDGHAETLALRDVYVDITNNRFNPATAK